MAVASPQQIGIQSETSRRSTTTFSCSAFPLLVLLLLLGLMPQGGVLFAESFQIQPFRQHQHLDPILDLSIRAWEPVFVSIQKTLEPAVYKTFYPAGWEVAQRASVNATCLDENVTTFVATATKDDDPENTDLVIGFTACKLHPDDCMGEIYMIAIDPDYQSRGIGSALAKHSLSWMKREGMKIAMVETGGDPGHAPARKLYESVGFRLWEVARYFQEL